MATLAEAAGGPEPVPPDSLAGEEAAAMARATPNLLRLWGVTDEQAAVLLGLPRHTFARWNAGKPGRIGPDSYARLSHLLGLHTALRLIVDDDACG